VILQQTEVPVSQKGCRNIPAAAGVKSGAPWAVSAMLVVAMATPYEAPNANGGATSHAGGAWQRPATTSARLASGVGNLFLPFPISESNFQPPAADQFLLEEGIATRAARKETPAATRLSCSRFHSAAAPWAVKAVLVVAMANENDAVTSPAGRAWHPPATTSAQLEYGVGNVLLSFQIGSTVYTHLQKIVTYLKANF
jgi:hypothetical protein